MKRVQQASRMNMGKALQPTRLSTPRDALLRAVEAEAGLSNARLARAASVSPPIMQGLLTDLECEGVLERHVDPTNARIRRATLRENPAFVADPRVAAAAGALYVPQVGIIDPSLLDPSLSLEVAVWVAGAVAAGYAGPSSTP